jgi:copper chaperone CopZ
MWIVAGAAMVLALAFVLVPPWASFAPHSSDAGLQKARISGTQTVSIPVEGMSCMVCASSVKRAAQGVDGVRDAEVDLAAKRAKVSYVEGKTSPEQIAAALRRSPTTTPADREAKSLSTDTRSCDLACRMT